MSDYRVGYNPSELPISGTTQVGDLTIGEQTSDWSLSPEGIRFWGSPEDTTGYIVAHPTPSGNQPNPLGIPAYLGFWRSEQKTESSFINLSEWISNYHGTPQIFTNGNDAKTWLNDNGYWTSYINLPTPTPTPTPSVTATETPTPTPSVTTTPTITSSQSPTPTNSPTITPSPTSNIVTSGLIIELDANSSTSYPGTGTSVFNLRNVGTYTHTLTDVTYTELNGIKCFNANGSATSIIKVPDGTGPTLPTSGYTYISWARAKTSSAQYRTLFRTYFYDHPILVQTGTDNLGFWASLGTPAFKDSGYDVTPIEDVWVQYAVVGDNSSSTFYINGTQVGTTPAGAGGQTHWAWGAIPDQGFGYVANMYYYDRKLSLSEITQQYNFLAPRFVEPTPTPTATNTPTLTQTPTTTNTSTPTKTPTPTSTPPPPVVSSGLELYYDPSNPSSYPGSGTILYDLSPSGANGTIGGSPALSGNGFVFTGSQNILSGNLFGLFAGWQHTLEIWVNPSIASQVFSDTSSGSVTSGYHASGLEFYSAGPFMISNMMLYNGTAVTRVGGSSTPLNAWYQYVRVYNGSNTAYAYVNKVKSSPETTITWVTPNPAWYLNFGLGDTTSFATSARFQGKLGVIRLYNRVLSQSEINQNYDATKSKYGL